MYCVEYYSTTIGDGTRCFPTDDARDAWLMGVSLEQFYLFTKETK